MMFCGHCKRPGATPGYVDDWGIGHMPNCESPECLLDDRRDTLHQRQARREHDEAYDSYEIVR